MSDEHNGPQFDVDPDTGEVIDDARQVRFRVLTKMTVATLNGQPERAKGLASGTRVPIAAIDGEVTGWRYFADSTDKRRSYRGLTGKFTAENWAGEHFLSTVLFLPSAYHDALLREVPPDGDGAGGVLEADSAEKLAEMQRKVIEEFNLAKTEEPRGVGNKSVEFHLHLYAMPAPRTPAGYTYDSDQPHEVSRFDPLTILKAKGRDILGALPKAPQLTGPGS